MLIQLVTNALWIKKGFYTNKEYDEYRLFMEQISRNDNIK
jgi:hypothetical protein